VQWVDDFLPSERLYYNASQVGRSPKRTNNARTLLPLEMKVLDTDRLTTLPIRVQRDNPILYRPGLLPVIVHARDVVFEELYTHCGLNSGSDMYRPASLADGDYLVFVRDRSPCHKTRKEWFAVCLRTGLLYQCLDAPSEQLQYDILKFRPCGTLACAPFVEVKLPTGDVVVETSKWSIYGPLLLDSYPRCSVYN
jgi:hypothetical protein